MSFTITVRGRGATVVFHEKTPINYRRLDQIRPGAGTKLRTLLSRPLLLEGKLGEYVTWMYKRNDPCNIYCMLFSVLCTAGIALFCWAIEPGLTKRRLEEIEEVVANKICECGLSASDFKLLDTSTDYGYGRQASFRPESLLRETHLTLFHSQGGADPAKLAEIEILKKQEKTLKKQLRLAKTSVVANKVAGSKMASQSSKSAGQVTQAKLYQLVARRQELEKELKDSANSATTCDYTDYLPGHPQAHGQSAHGDRQSSSGSRRTAATKARGAPQQTARESYLPTRAHSGRSNHETATGTASRRRTAGAGTRESLPQSLSTRQSTSEGTSTIITSIRRASQSSQGPNGVVVIPQKKRQQLEP